jgi:hypothetical protein
LGVCSVVGTPPPEPRKAKVATKHH